MGKFDEYLYFDLPRDYFILDELDDEGERNYRIVSGKNTDDQGKEQYKYALFVKNVDNDDTPFADGADRFAFSLEGNLDNYIMVLSKEMKISIYTVDMMEINIWLKYENHIYTFLSKRACQRDNRDDIGKWLTHIVTSINSADIVDRRVKLTGLTIDRVLEECKNVDELKAQKIGIPFAQPKENQHTHLDFLNRTKAGMSIFGGIVNVNNSGTEYSFEQISELFSDCSLAEADVFDEISNAPIEVFDLVETAHDMAELFRVNIEVFNGGHDREQEILNGLVQKAALFNKFRSFAWTFAAYCDKNKIEPLAVDIDSIQKIIGFIDEREGLNYTADSYSPTLCSGDDLHVYYIPDSVSAKNKNRFIKLANRNVDDDDAINLSEVKSLNKLREELDYMYPAIRAIYDDLEASRDRDEALFGGIADILYVWCSMTYAAREPIFSEDGPVNCWWEHPDEAENWETKWKIDQLENAINAEKEKIKKYSKDISKNITIDFKNNTFVFSGVEGLDIWLDILQKLTELGGIQRSSVSGKTNYLIWNPAYAGETKIRHALEQRIKGKDVKIVLLKDFLKAIKMTAVSPQEQLEALKNERKEKKQELSVKHLKPVNRPLIDKPENKTEEFTYNNGTIAKGNGYTIELPDGFAVKENVDGRDFVAYIPNDDEPDEYLNSRFIIFAGQLLKIEALGQLRLATEYGTIIRKMENVIPGIFSKSWNTKYLREDLPGGILFGYAAGCIHANAFLAVDDHFQTMRIQIDGVNKKQCDEYEEIVKVIFNHMKADKPVKTLQKIDENCYVGMALDAKTVTKWTDCVKEYIKHIAISRNMEQAAIASEFEKQRNNGDANIVKLRKDILGMLREISKLAEDKLVVAEAVYTLKRAQYPNNTHLTKMAEVLDELTELTKQEVNLDEEHLEVTSDYAQTVKKRMKANAGKAIDEILASDRSSLLSIELKNAMGAARADYEKVKNDLFEKELIAKRERLNTLAATIEDIKEKRNKSKEIFENLERKKNEDYKKYQEACDNYNKKKPVLKREITGLNKKIKTLSEEYENAYYKFNAEEKENDAVILSMNHEIMKEKANLEMKQEVINAYKSKAEKSLFFKKKYIAIYQTKLAEGDVIKAKIDSIINNQRIIIDKKTKDSRLLCELYEDITNKQETIRKQIAEKQKRIDEIISEYEKINESYSGFIKQYSAAEKELKDYEKKLLNLTNERNDLMAELE